ncbi:MAG: DegT/DnrJ/EryC1/StrS family aminotransferase [Armatimonadetes bacterium]|nr:DegT/DnrJ/EryC1/StrS family aminotransferase [Armatimonadota bacterium]
MAKQTAVRQLWYKPVMTDEMVDAVASVLRSGKYIRSYPFEPSEGKHFEDEFRAYLGCKFAANLQSGTAAMHLALIAIGIGPGDEVITVPNTFSSVADVIILCGAKPVFVDVEPDTYNMNVSLVEAAITPRTKAIMPVHMNGHAVDMDPLMEIARRRGLKVMEDVCHAAGAKYKGKFLGTIGDAGAFSFVQNKCISAGGEGGLVATDSEAIWTTCAAMANHGRWKTWFEGHKQYEVYLAQHIDRPAYNYRQNEVQSAIARIQLRYLDEWNAIRRRNTALYHKLLRQFDNDIALPATRPWAEHSMLRYVIKTPRRDALKHFLEENGVHVMVEYGTPIHLDRGYQQYCGAPEGTFPVTEKLARTIMTLPAYQTMTADEVVHVVDIMKEFYKK